MHLLLHASGNMAFRSLRMIQLHDIARLAARMSGDDWTTATRDPCRWWALPPLTLTARYYPKAIPAGLVADLAPGCTRTLRRFCGSHALTDVSLSNPWVEFLPGIEWSRTPLERARYVFDRILPGRELLASREDLVTSHPWMNEDPWARMPQWRRMLRWITSRPPRVQTMYPVRAVLTTLPTDAERSRHARHEGA
jgi:hypothetical protein